MGACLETGGLEEHFAFANEFLMFPEAAKQMAVRALTLQERSWKFVAGKKGWTWWSRRN